MKAKYSYEKEELQIDFKDIRKTIKIFPQKHQTARVRLALVLVFLGPRVNLFIFLLGFAGVFVNDQSSQWLNQVVAEVFHVTNSFPFAAPSST